MLDLALRIEARLLQEETPLLLLDEEDEDEDDEESVEEDLGLDGLAPLGMAEVSPPGGGELFTNVFIINSMWSL
jgi:hypothetical protein